METAVYLTGNLNSGHAVLAKDSINKRKQQNVYKFFCVITVLFSTRPQFPKASHYIFLNTWAEG
jgi:hypothetical protein